MNQKVCIQMAEPNAVASHLVKVLELLRSLEYFACRGLERAVLSEQPRRISLRSWLDVARVVPIELVNFDIVLRRECGEAFLLGIHPRRAASHCCHYYNRSNKYTSHIVHKVAPVLI